MKQMMEFPDSVWKVIVRIAVEHDCSTEKVVVDLVTQKLTDLKELANEK